MYTTCLTSSEAANVLISTEFRIPFLRMFGKIMHFIQSIFFLEIDTTPNMDTLTLFPIDKFMGASRLIFRNSTLIVYLDDEIEKFTKGKFDF